MAKDMADGQPDLLRIQRARRATLAQFADYVSNNETQRRAMKEPELFALIISLGVGEYGVRQVALATELQISSAAISRWMSSQSLPVSYGRPHILQVLGQIIRDNLAAQSARPDDLLNLPKGTVSA